MTLMLGYLLPLVCFLVGAAFGIDAINSLDAWSMGIALISVTAGFLLVRRIRQQRRSSPYPYYFKDHGGP
jgi:positive regulator of sigma E activity